MARRLRLALLVCLIVVASGAAYFSLVPRESKPSFQPTTQSGIQPSLEKTPELNVAVFVNSVPAVFPEMVNVTSVIRNANERAVDSLEIVQTTPEGFNLTDTYLVGPDGSRSSYMPAVTPSALRYSSLSTLGPKETVSIVVLLHSTPTAVSGSFTTEVKGTYDGKWVQSRASKWIYVPPSRTVCSDWATLAFGEFLLENNVWGGPAEPHLQCVTFGPGSFGWNLSRPSPSDNDECDCIQPYYPEVIYGKKPWRSESTTGSLPVLVDSIKTLEVSLAVSMNPYEKYNLAFDIWITNQTEGIPVHITDELMIWLVWTPDLAGENIIDVLNDGQNVYQHRAYAHWDMIQTSGALKWRYHQFTLTKQVVPPKMNILTFLNHLKKEGHDLRYLASIELGNEVWSGAGATNVTMLRIDLKTASNMRSPMTADQESFARNEWHVIADRCSADTPPKMPIRIKHNGFGAHQSFSCVDQ
jgi:hypothetical protein